MAASCVAFGLGVTAADASAHTATLSADCSAAHFQWSNFATTGSNNSGQNTPAYSVALDGGAPTTGNAAFAGASFSKDVALNLSGPHTVVMSSSWTAAQTRDRNAGSTGDKTFRVNCTGTLKVTKVLSPSSDPGRFNIAASGPTPISQSNVGDGGTTGTKTVNSGSYTVSEAATSTATDLANYDSSVSCKDTAAGHTGTKSGTGTSLSGVPIATGDAWECTITNTRKPTPPPTPPAETPPAAVAPAASGILPVSITSGRASLHGQAGCARASVVTATVTGRAVSRVSYSLDGRHVRTVTKADKAGRWTLHVRTRSVRRGAHQITARVQFTASSQTRARLLRMAFVRCGSAAVRPHFTG